MHSAGFSTKRFWRNPYLIEIYDSLKELENLDCLLISSVTGPGRGDLAGSLSRGNGQSNRLFVTGPFSPSPYCV